MVGFEKTWIEQETYLDYLIEMSDDRLEEEARDYVFLAETSLGGPWEHYVWRRDFSRDEIERRGQGERYERAQARILEGVERRGLSGRGRFCP